MPVCCEIHLSMFSKFSDFWPRLTFLYFLHASPIFFLETMWLFRMIYSATLDLKIVAPFSPLTLLPPGVLQDVFLRSFWFVRFILFCNWNKKYRISHTCPIDSSVPEGFELAFLTIAMLLKTTSKPCFPSFFC